MEVLAGTSSGIRENLSLYRDGEVLLQQLAHSFRVRTHRRSMDVLLSLILHRCAFGMHSGVRRKVKVDEADVPAKAG
jgi:hypothetical protein